MSGSGRFGLLAFVLNYIPYLGAICGILATAMIGLVSFDEPLRGLMPSLGYLVINFLEGQFITPYFVGKSLKINTVVVFLSIAFWAWLWSVIGMLVALPLLVTARAFCEHIPRLAPLADLISERGEEAGETADAADASRTTSVEKHR